MINRTTRAPSFDGFQSPNFTAVPDEVFDRLLADLSGAELKVLLYVIRRPFGLKTGSDRISKAQLAHGIQRRDGPALAHGTGLSRPPVRLPPPRGRWRTASAATASAGQLCLFMSVSLGPGGAVGESPHTGEYGPHCRIGHPPREFPAQTHRAPHQPTRPGPAGTGDPRPPPRGPAPRGPRSSRCPLHAGTAYVLRGPVCA